MAISPPNQWGWSEIFENKIVYLLETLLWQNAYNPKKKAEHKAKRPKPFVPDFMKSLEQPSGANKETELHTTDDIRRILKMPRG